ncbi:MAG: DUF2807 domain-containing protein [Cyclobacteriaceae bacterium]|nr:DUF2807 domain-containing protein [Cyclobacteriaceae bacterium]
MKTQTNILFGIVFTTMFFIFLSPATAQNKVVREIDTFDEVSVSDNMHVTFTQSDKERITIVAHGIGYDKVVTETAGRALKIKLKTGIYKDTDIKIEVEYVKLRSIEATNKAELKFADVLKGDQLAIRASTNGVINLRVDVAALKVNVTNGGRIEIAGKTDMQEVDASIGANYNAYELKSEHAYVKSNANSDVVVWVIDKLEATAGSKAEVKYRGKPADVQSSTNLGGKISGDL